MLISVSSCVIFVQYLTSLSHSVLICKTGKSLFLIRLFSESQVRVKLFFKIGIQGCQDLSQVKDGFQQTVLGKVGIHMQRNEVVPLSNTKYKS